MRLPWYIHNLVTPYYLKYRKVIDTANFSILDVGCGTGYTTLCLAEANPGAKIVGIDISEKSIELARQRLQHHNCQEVEFHVLSIEDVTSLNRKFDYINCDEVLYLVSEPINALRMLRSILKPKGVLRANLHSYYQREAYFRSQELFKMIGLMEQAPDGTESEKAVGIFKALNNSVNIKAKTWTAYQNSASKDEFIYSNYLIRGDKGYTINDLFSMLEAVDLEFINMVNWRKWNIASLFQDNGQIPATLLEKLKQASPQEYLRIFELINPVHRLLDFWCCHPSQNIETPPLVLFWSDKDWQRGIVHLHPQLRTPAFRKTVIESVRNLTSLAISRYLPLSNEHVAVDSSLASCLIPLLDGPQAVMQLVKRWRQIQLVDPVTVGLLPSQHAYEVIKRFLTQYEMLGYILLESRS